MKTLTWNIAPEVISLVFLGIIWVYSRKGSSLPSLKNKMFQSCLLVTFSAMLSNILSTLMIYNYQAIPLWMTWGVTMIYFILTPLMGMVYFFYIISIIYTDNIRLKRIMGIGSVPGILYFVLVIINPVRGVLFDIHRENGYVRGPLITLTYIVFYAYCLASIAVTIANKKQIDRKIYRILAAFPILAVLVIIVQQIFSDIILSGSAATCALLIIYLHLQNKQISVDYLTNVPNRHELLDMLGLIIKKNPEKKFILIVVSLRDFRQINNTCGQQNGDLFLKAVCNFLCSVGPRENVYRFSGDEFALLFRDENEGMIRKCVADIKERMAEPWKISDYWFVLSAVIGVIRRGEAEETLEETINAIEYAVYEAKTGKYGQVCYCDKAMLGKMQRRRKIIQILKDQLASESFEMYYQPIYVVKTEEFLFAESLMRMNHTPIGPVYPSEFIPIAEETGLIIDMTYVILDKVCKFINRLTAQGISIGSIHVNFSAVQFSQLDLAEKVLKIIQSNGTRPSAIKIEFTESTLGENPSVVTEFVMEMKRHGIMIGLDDFGTGYSNISTVINIPFGTIKLDKSLIWGSIGKPTSSLAVRNMVRTFKDLGMIVIAEGVETDEQLQLVQDFQVDQIQGYYYSKPLSETDMEAFLRDRAEMR